MQDKQLYEYAVIRLVPMVEREEFMNIGVVLYCAGQKYLKVLFTLDEQRIKALNVNIDMDELNAYLHAFQTICAGNKSAGPIAGLTIPERFRWLTATRSTIVQTSKVHPGLCADAETMLQQLYRQMVLTPA